ncbi:cell growth regulator with RING finger domain protein 1-like [Pomacea canaliculata]|uniref:cell growth regulator with RING finger domain protein 1-like n=1 Tax=Pomacea canaliculata TaxID=400727 RepID=UPI000D72DD76|nr:cell growth regulator with RING finger domain protein 1-like [Pomacea canaliculata]
MWKHRVSRSVNMADELSLVLWSIEEYFNYFVIVLILMSSMLLALFIIRLSGGYVHHANSELETSSLAYEKHIKEVCNPFYLTFSGSASSNLTDGVSLEISCLLLSKLHVFWGPGVDAIQKVLLKDGLVLLEELNSNYLLRDQCLAHEQYRLDTAGRLKLHLPTPLCVTEEALGYPPRKYYPCVIIMTADVSNEVQDAESVVAAVTIIHLKDKQCPLNSYIIAQYAKMSGPSVYNLQPLYFASVPEDSNDMENKNETEIPIQQNETASSSSADGCLLPATDDAQAKSTHKASISSPAYSCQGLEAHQRRKKHTDNSVQDLDEASSTDCRLLGSYNSRPTMGAAAAGETLDITYLSHVGDPNYSHDFPDCIVCQTQRLTCVLLPCRHACVCRRCFLQLDRCPMCRSHVESYFLIGDEQSSSKSGTRRRIHQAYFPNLNLSITD